MVVGVGGGRRNRHCLAEGSKYSILRVMYTCSKVVGGGEPEMLVECSEW